MCLLSSVTRLGNLLHFLEPVATIILPKLPTFSGKFCKSVKIFHFSRDIIFGQLLLTFGDFLLVTLLLSIQSESLVKWIILFIGSFSTFHRNNLYINAMTSLQYYIVIKIQFILQYKKNGQIVKRYILQQKIVERPQILEQHYNSNLIGFNQ